ncbi:MAG TPA: hypothetical protein P5330_04425, partial [Candidatus Competibacteraceae bacterium]|nr:hypothetical protein [Candidatus Competibacteraceae bacterium]
MSKNKTLIMALTMLTGAGIGVVHAESGATTKSTRPPSWESYLLQWDSAQLGPRPFYLVEGMDEG